MSAQRISFAAFLMRRTAARAYGPRAPSTLFGIRLRIPIHGYMINENEAVGTWAKA